MTPIIAIALTLLVSYTVTLCVVNKSIPSSLSASVFALPPGGQWLWTLVIGLVAMLMMPTLLDKTPEEWQFLAFLGCAGLLFVAFAPLVKDKTDMAYLIHMAGAYDSAVCSQLLVAVRYPWLLLLWLPWAAVFVWHLAHRKKWRTQTFWAEQTCFASIFLYALI